MAVNHQVPQSDRGSVSGRHGSRTVLNIGKSYFDSGIIFMLLRKFVIKIYFFIIYLMCELIYLLSGIVSLSLGYYSKHFLDYLIIAQERGLHTVQ